MLAPDVQPTPASWLTSSDAPPQRFPPIPIRGARYSQGSGTAGVAGVPVTSNAENWFPCRRRRPRPHITVGLVEVPVRGIREALQPVRRVSRNGLLAHDPVRRTRVKCRADPTACEVHHCCRWISGVASHLRQRIQDRSRHPPGIRFDVHQSTGRRVLRPTHLTHLSPPMPGPHRSMSPSSSG